MPPKLKQTIKAESNIDLQCTLCPKNPKFSDASHLLTHIASKGHLSHRFKLQIRAQSEQNARDILENFDLWYTASNMDNLLADRLALKENKSKRKPRASGPSSRTAVKSEVKQDPATLINDIAGASSFHAPIPRMHLWSISGDAGLTSPTNEFVQATIYSTPTSRSQVPNFSFSESQSVHKLDPQLTTPWKPELPENKDSEGNKLTDSAKLKGIIWPGMDLFDSATPEQKRMRNQKKDNSILRGMLNASLDVEPTEISYHANGELRTSRDIFGPLSDLEDSPTKIRSRSASPKKRKPRKPTTNADPSNAPRPRALRGRKPGTRVGPKKKTTLAMQAPPPVFMQPAPILNPLAGGGIRFLPDEYNEELRLTTNKTRSKKRGFSIFQDPDMLEISPSRTESPLDEQNYDEAPTLAFGVDPFIFDNHRFQNNGLPSYANLTTSSIMQLSPTPTSRPGPFRPTGKENMLQQTEVQQQHQSRRTLSASHVYPAQVFHDPARNPLFQRHHGYTHSLSHIQNPHLDQKSPRGYTPNFGPHFPASYRPVAQMTVPQQMGQSQGQVDNLRTNGSSNGSDYM